MRIRPIQPEDSPAVAAVIREVMPEYGAGGAGFAVHDAEVSDMYASYQAPRAAYFVVNLGGKIVGGAGVAPLAGGDAQTCELRKMYLLPEARGKGIGGRLLALCLDAARGHGFTRCYLETLESMTEARALYARYGFEKIAKPLGDTGHFGCDAWYVKDLTSRATP